jgi:hypothetical protein
MSPRKKSVNTEIQNGLRHMETPVEFETDPSTENSIHGHSCRTLVILRPFCGRRIPTSTRTPIGALSGTACTFDIFVIPIAV